MKRSIEIQNLKCSGCAHTITNSLRSIEGVKNLFIKPEERTVVLTYQDENVFEKVREKLSSIGYPMVGDKNNSVKKALSYVSCAMGKLNK